MPFLVQLSCFAAMIIILSGIVVIIKKLIERGTKEDKDKKEERDDELNRRREIIRKKGIKAKINHLYTMVEEMQYLTIVEPMGRNRDDMLAVTYHVGCTGSGMTQAYIDEETFLATFKLVDEKNPFDEGERNDREYERASRIKCWSGK